MGRVPISSMGKMNFQRILAPLFLLSVFLLAICKILAADIWMHLSFGRLIWNLKGFPANEPFVYTMLDKPFSYSSWLFGLIYYLAYSVFDVYGVILLKAVTITAAFYILLQDALRPYKNYTIAVFVMTFIVIICRHRFVERPDTFMMFFLPFTIFSLNKFVYENKNYIYSLPVISMLWANSHSSINLMAIPFLAFVFGGLIQKYLDKKGGRLSSTPSASQFNTILLIFFASFAAALLNPNFFGQLTFGGQFLESGWYKQNIIELSPPTWDTFKSPYLIPPIIAASIVLNWFMVNGPGPSENRRYSAIVHILLIIPFIILSFTARRFVFILAIVAGPIIAINMSALFERSKEIFKAKVVIIITAIWVVIYASLTIAAVKPFESRGMAFGLGINYDLFPEGALKYMDKRKITGRVFNQFSWGQYIVWRDFPKRTPFIDGRGYVPDGMLEKKDLATQDGSILDELYKKYGFESILIGYPMYDAGIRGRDVDLALSSQKWALVYWDDLSLVYLKRDGIYDSVIKEDEYRFVKPANGIDRTSINYLDYRSNLIRELKRNIEETSSSKAYAFLGIVYRDIGLYKEAIDSYSKVRDFTEQSHLAPAYSGMALAYYKLGQPDEAIKYYKKSLSIYTDPVVLYQLGNIYKEKGDNKTALEFLHKALEINKKLTVAYPSVIGIYRDLGREDEANRWTKLYEASKREEERYR